MTSCIPFSLPVVIFGHAGLAFVGKTGRVVGARRCGIGLSIPICLLACVVGAVSIS